MERRVFSVFHYQSAPHFHSFSLAPVCQSSLPFETSNVYSVFFWPSKIHSCITLCQNHSIVLFILLPLQMQLHIHALSCPAEWKTYFWQLKKKKYNFYWLHSIFDALSTLSFYNWVIFLWGFVCVCTHTRVWGNVVLLGVFCFFWAHWGDMFTLWEAAQSVAVVDKTDRLGKSPGKLIKNTESWVLSHSQSVGILRSRSANPRCVKPHRQWPSEQDVVFRATQCTSQPTNFLSFSFFISK